MTFNLPRTIGGVSVFSLLPSNARTVTGLPPAGSPNYFASIYGSYNIRVWKFHVDWANTANSTFTGPTNASSGTFNVGPSTVPEKSGNNLDTLSYRLMMQNQYTNQGGRESLWLTHTVGNGGSPNVAQVRWYELPVTGGTVASSPRQVVDVGARLEESLHAQPRRRQGREHGDRLQRLGRDDVAGDPVRRPARDRPAEHARTG